MLSKEDNRRLAQLERQLLRDDPEFCARMQPDRPLRKRVPISLVLTASVVWAVVIVLALAIRCRPARRHDDGHGLLPPSL